MRSEQMAIQNCETGKMKVGEAITNSFINVFVNRVLIKSYMPNFQTSHLFRLTNLRNISVQLFLLTIKYEVKKYIIFCPSSGSGGKTQNKREDQWKGKFKDKRKEFKIYYMVQVKRKYLSGRAKTK